MTGLALLTHTYEFALGVQLPLDHTASREDRVAVMALMDIFYDRLIPGIPEKFFD